MKTTSKTTKQTNKQTNKPHPSFPYDISDQLNKLNNSATQAFFTNVYKRNLANPPTNARCSSHLAKCKSVKEFQSTYM